MSDKTTNSTAREKFEIELDENLDFPSIADTAYMTSVELCKITSDLFHNVFADFEGCIFDATSGTEPTVSLLFNHGDYSNTDMHVACELAGGNNSGSAVIDRVRKIDSFKLNGDRYFLTEDGSDAIMDLLMERLYNNGKPDWGKIVADFYDKSTTYGGYYSPYNNAPVYTKVSGISLKRLCRLLFGDKDEKGKYEYDVRMLSALNPGFGAPQNTVYMLQVSKISEEQLNAVLAKVGLGNANNNIIR